VLLIVGLLAGAAAAAMAVMKKSAPKDDPWTTPLADSYGATPNGRHSAPSPVDKASTMTTTEPETIAVDSPDDAGKPSAKDKAEEDLTHEVPADEDLTDKGSTSRNGARKSGTDKNPHA
jgi:hypothetical protein